MNRFLRLLLPAAAGFGVAGLAASAQEATSTELQALFGKQLINGSKTRSLADRPKHRGLVLVAADAPATKEIEFTPVEAENQVNIRIGFDFDSAALREGERAKLAPLCAAMTEMADTRFRVIGHTDASGEGGYNDNLSLRRALSVQNYLDSGCGISAGRLEAVGVGERYLADSTDPASAINRRVEFQAVPGSG